MILIHVTKLCCHAGNISRVFVFAVGIWILCWQGTWAAVLLLGGQSNINTLILHEIFAFNNLTDYKFYVTFYGNGHIYVFKIQRGHKWF